MLIPEHTMTVITLQVHYTIIFTQSTADLTMLIPEHMMTVITLQVQCRVNLTQSTADLTMLIPEYMMTVINAYYAGDEGYLKISGFNIS